MKLKNVDFTIKDLFDNLLHYGHRVEFTDPRMNQYIFAKKDGVAIIDLVQTHHLIVQVIEVVKHMSRRNARFLFAGTNQATSKIVKKYAIECGQYYASGTWTGGILTNWTQVSKSISQLERLEAILNSDKEKSKYTKKEIADMTRKVEALEARIGGLKGMRNLPQVVLLFGSESKAKKQPIPLREARALGILTIAVVDTNSNPQGIDYVIPANDDSAKSISFILGLISKAIIHGIKESVLNKKG
jgi:small subunit ribosomal protein S2